MSKMKHIVIVGGGPAGLMAAEQLAQAGFGVEVYDRMASPARKLLIAGRGGLNLTHSEPLEIFLTRYGSAQEWLAPSIEAFTPQALREWCEGLGEPTYVGSSGRVFPKRMKASGLVRAWLARLAGLGVTYHGGWRWLGWDAGGAMLFEHAGEKQTVQADACLLALGGASWAKLGSDGAWQDILRGKGVRVEALKPANCGFVATWSAYFAEHHAGTPLKPVTIRFAGASVQGEAMITKDGLEGGVMYALSGMLRDAIDREGHASITLDLRPGIAVDELAKKLGARGSRSFTAYLKRAGFAPVVPALLHDVAPRAQQLGEIELAALLKAVPVRLCGTSGMARAISSAGGIACSEVDERFMLKALPGVFAAGEMLDWEAPTGGYLLQGCFSTAVAAAAGIRAYLS